MASEKNERRFPLVEIGPHDVVDYGRRRWQQPTIADATDWLEKHGTQFQKDLQDLLNGAIDTLFDEVALNSYPDPKVDAEFRKLDDAIFDAATAYGASIGKEIFRYEVVDHVLLQIASLLLSKRPTSFRACFEMEHEFCSPNATFSGKTTLHRTRRVHLSIEDGR